MTINPQNMDVDEDHRPRYMVFSKMEKMVREMQHADSGVPVRCQKIFLTTIPCAFTGSDLVEWITNHLKITDSSEVLHLASLLCQYGYFFPVTDSRSLMVKDDGTLYRFQSPYFWPSQNWEPDNVDYAIYLAKRSLRNKQRHGLEDYELAAFNKLQKMLCDKWDFIYMQAEEQVRLAKERKKADKVVIDSQERAFWKVHRPPPGQAKCLEEGVRRNFKPSQMAHKRKKNLEFYKKEILYLTQAISRPRMKVSKATESLMNHCESYLEHDGFLSTPLPSNPWVSEDMTMWILNTVLVETPTERRVKRWAFSLSALLSDASGFLEFECFLQKEYSAENIHFWQECEQLKFCPQSQVQEKADRIYKEYLCLGAPSEVNIDGKTMEKTQENLKSPTRFTFEAAQGHIFLLMKKDSYTRFLRSDQYKNLLATAINPCPKRKIFKFGVGGGGTKKKSPNPSPKSKRRGSASSELNTADRDIQGKALAQHSYSTGNLKDLDVERSSSPYMNGSRSPGSRSPDSLSSRIRETYIRKLSPRALRKKLDELMRSESPTRSNLEVPKYYQAPEKNGEEDSPKQNSLTVPKHNSHTGESSSHEEATACLALAVPSKFNIVAPWEASE